MYNVKRLREVELDLLKHFIEICNNNNLTYYALGGTVLGAIRHNGFIPWDDDIDVGMPRKDYEKFAKIASKQLPSNIFFQTRKTDPEYYLNFGKLRNSNTTFVETAVKSRNINHGIFIDIFPLEYYPEKKKDQIIVDIKNLMMRFRFKNELDKSISSRVPIIKKTVNFILSKFMVCVFPSLNSAYNYRNRLYMSTKKSSIWANYGGSWGKKEIMPARWYGKGVKKEFEGLSITVPEKYDLWLRHMYGDYMILPPVEKRISHHYTEIINTEKSYKELWKKT